MLECDAPCCRRFAPAGRQSQAQFRGECCLPVPRESVACSRTLYLSTCPTGRNQGVKGQVTLVATVPSRRHDQGKKTRLEPCLFWRCEFFCMNATGGAAKRHVRHSPAETRREPSRSVRSHQVRLTFQRLISSCVA